ncbi:LytR/AlgR family response regulator transcription factor [Desulfoferrobacter suflitae]|uniref:LytR/AlgR family response regulator transcription factor n=1 Tax=Desulfoferrobacter suflitae TaxID=2865782 RepID=UPI002164CE54|nr:response regulator [Desulfoferrobacter suflitae]MCK8600499.1 response regulator [Desulfoferrobacter suflitae]
MHPVSCVLVDDERLAREKLRALLRAYQHIVVVGEADSAERALQVIQSIRPRLVFLEIQMPSGSGFDLLDQLEDPPAVIFVTAYDQYAIRAFEVNAVDYLLKPIHPERLETALKRVLPAPPPPASPRELTMHDRVFIDTGHRRIFVPLVSICAVCADGDYTKLYASDGDTLMVRRSLKSWYDVLPDDFSEFTGMRSSTCVI